MNETSGGLTKPNESGVVLRFMLENNWHSFLSYFISSQDIKDSSRKLYYRTLKQFFSWVDISKRNINDLNRTDILEYKSYLFSKGLTSLSVASYLTSLRKFYEWTEGEKIYPNIAKDIKTPRRTQAFKKQHLSNDKIVELLKYFEGKSKRNYAIVNLILRTGLRTIEVIRADIGDITFKGNKRILLIWGKGHDTKDDYVVLTDKAYFPIKEYLKTRTSTKQNEPLFISASTNKEPGRLTTRSISSICKKGLQAIGLDGKEFTAHSLRHTTAVTILKNGGSMTDAQTVLRHTSPTTTQIYTESIKEELRLADAPEELIDKAF